MRQGDIIKLDFDPHVGHEQAGYRPAVVISNAAAIARMNLVYVCPITNNLRPDPLRLALDKRTKTTGMVLCDQVRAVDLTNRAYRHVERIPRDLLLEMIDIVHGMTTADED